MGTTTETKMWKTTSETTPETAQKKPIGLERFKKVLKESRITFKKRIKELFTGPDNEEAWNKFPEEAKKEMLKSLDMRKEVDLHSIKLNYTVECKYSFGDYNEFAEGTIKNDKIGNYVEIDGLKCREWQPGISGFVFQNIQDRYHRDLRLEIGFCEKGNFVKSVIIDNKGKVVERNQDADCEYPDYAIPSGISAIKRKEEAKEKKEKGKEKKE